jgi:hypothetical protein
MVNAFQNLAYHIQFILKYFNIRKVEKAFSTKRTVIFQQEVMSMDAVLFLLVIHKEVKV